jgi:hypothetical protein
VKRYDAEYLFGIEEDIETTVAAKGCAGYCGCQMADP